MDREPLRDRDLPRRPTTSRSPSTRLMRIVAGNSIANVTSVTPGGAGVTQAFNVASLNGVTSATNATAYSVAQQLVTTAWNLILAIILMAWAFGWSGGQQLVEQSYSQAKAEEAKRKAAHQAKKDAKRGGRARARLSSRRRPRARRFRSRGSAMRRCCSSSTGRGSSPTRSCGRRIVHLRALHRSPSRAELGRIDAVLLSHAHRDHARRPVARPLGRRRCRSWRPHAVVRSLRRRGFRRGSTRSRPERSRGRQPRGAGDAGRARPSRLGRRLSRPRNPTVYFAGDTDLFPGMEGSPTRSTSPSSRSGAGARVSARATSTRSGPPRRCACSGRGSSSPSTGAPSIRSGCRAQPSSASRRRRSAASCTSELPRSRSGC